MKVHEVKCAKAKTRHALKSQSGVTVADDLMQTSKPHTGQILVPIPRILGKSPQIQKKKKQKVVKSPAK